MGDLELFALIGLGAIVAMLCWGKLLDRGQATDRSRVIFPNGPELDDDENLAEICSPFEYKDLTKADTPTFQLDAQSVAKNNEPQLNLDRRFESEVKLDDYLKSRHENQKDD